jgi:asparagine synthase (glutamine-hydrolysing)
MCGICGIAGVSNSGDAASILEVMSGLLSHRGPDDRGEYLDPSQEVALGHTRLAILDLSQSGHQPMISRDGRFVIVFNGEIYNYRELRAELESSGLTFSTNTDTEVILVMFGLLREKCLNRFQGMFAFAIWDTVSRELFLARDPLGIKPLYVWSVGDRVAFGSEVKSVLAADLGPKELSLQAAMLYFQLGSVPEPYTLVNGISAIPCGHYAVWRAGVLDSPVQYWDIVFSAKIRDRDQASDCVRLAMEESVSRHFVSDVPVGLFLSGGVDSTVLLALATALGHRDLRTFCISFDDAKFDEGTIAQRTASHFGTRHTDWRLSSIEGQQLVSGFLNAMDRPTTDGFNTYCVSKLASESGMKVVLSGVGGDELFSGYPSFEKIPLLLKLNRRLQRFGGAAIACRVIKQLGAQSKWLRLRQFLMSDGTVSDAWLAVRGFFTMEESEQLLARLVGASVDEISRAVTNTAPPLPVSSRQESVADQISRLELTRYMRNQLLRDSDVMSMQWGLELRTPFVDSRLIDSVGRISSDIRLAYGKQILKAAVPEIPQWVLDQRKRGFSFPFEIWAKQCWAEWFEQIDHGSPVECRTWYRKWCLIALQHFLDSNGIAYSGDRLDCLAA